MRRSLYHIFSQYGSVIDVVALKTEKLRGQAWVVFDSVPDATHAMRQLQKFPFYDKEMAWRFPSWGVCVAVHHRRRFALPPAVLGADGTAGVS